MEKARVKRISGKWTTRERSLHVEVSNGKMGEELFDVGRTCRDDENGRRRRCLRWLDFIKRDVRKAEDGGDGEK